MAKRLRVRPISKGILYTFPGHVIGGSEPRSWEFAKGIRRSAQLRGAKKPARLGLPMRARKKSFCGYCGGKIAKGQPIAAADLEGKRRWLHQTCTTRPEPAASAASGSTSGTRRSSTGSPTADKAGPEAFPHSPTPTLRAFAVSLLAVWTECWGTLPDDLQQQFLDYPRMSEFQSFGLAASVDAICRHKKLNDAIADLQQRRSELRQAAAR